MSNRRGAVMINSVVFAAGLAVVLIGTMFTMHVQVRGARTQILRTRARLLLDSEFEYMRTLPTTKLAGLKDGRFSAELSPHKSIEKMLFSRVVEQAGEGNIHVTLEAKFPDDIRKCVPVRVEGVLYGKE